MTTIQKLQPGLHRATFIFFVLACFFTPLSSSLMGGFAICAFVFWIISGRIVELPRLLASNAAIGASFGLFLLLVIGLFYSPEILGDGLAVLKKYRELLFFIMAYSLAKNDPETSTAPLDAFLCGCMVLLTLSYAMYCEVIPMEKYGYSTVYHITHSFFMAFLGFYCLQKLFDKKAQHFLWFMLFLFTLFNLFFIAPGRTGMFIFIILTALTLVQHASLQYSFTCLLVASLGFGGVYFISDNFSGRIQEAVNEVRNYQPTSSRTSLGQRFDWWHNSVDLIREKPLLGHGTGSFGLLQQQLIKGTRTKPTDNPHNEYLLLAVQTGVVGLAIFVLWLLSLLVISRALERTTGHVLQGIVVAMAAGCLFNSFLYDSHQGHFFAMLTGSLMARLSDPPGPTEDSL